MTDNRICCPPRSHRLGRECRRLLTALPLALLLFGSLQAFGPRAAADTLPVHVQDAPSIDSRLTPPGFPLELEAIRSGFRPQETSLRTLAADPQYPFSELNKLSYADLVTRLTSIQWSQIPDLFSYNSDTQAFYGDQNRVKYIIEALRQRGAQYTTTDLKGIRTLVEVLRSGFYLGFYNNSLSYLNERSFHDLCLPAIRAMIANPNFGFGTAVQDEVINAIGLLIANASTAPDICRSLAPTIRSFKTNAASWMTSSRKTNSLYALCDGIHYDLTYDLLYQQSDPTQTVFYGQINDFVEAIGELSVYGKPDSSWEWVINNAVWWTGRLGRFHNNPSRINRFLTDAISINGHWPEASIQAAQLIVDYYGGTDANGNAIDLDQIRTELRASLLPNTYRFDDGALILHTGTGVTLEKVKRLYWAAKEVKAQFHRLNGRDSALEQGHPDDVLTMVVYSSPEDYKYNYFLNGVSTDNGGIYIETWGTFFTFERPYPQYYLTLEDLFRHEFNHFLQGRFQEPGMWGDSPLYDNDRLTWFDEGTAEFLAGSSRMNDIRTRKTCVGDISANASERYTVSQVVHATYSSGWTFYTYSFAFSDFLYKSFPDKILEMVRLLQAGDATGFSAYMETLAEDTSLNTSFQAHMQYLKDHSSELVDPSTSDDYLADIPARPVADVASEIGAATGLSGIASQVLDSPGFWKTFIVSGTWTTGSSAGKTADWRTMNTTADGFLQTLTAHSWTGFRTATCHFGNYRTLPGGGFAFDVVFTGKLQSSVPAAGGDLNHDGRVDAVDALILAAYLTGTPLPQGTSLGDCELVADGEVNAADLSHLLNRIAGNIL